jgi:adenylate kinase
VDDGVKAVRVAVFLGAPGSGKGTQAKRLAEAGRCVHLSSGDVLRQAVRAGTDLGRRAKDLMDRGEYVPDALMIELISTELKKLPASQTVVLDGFPRTLAQAEALDRDASTCVKKAIFFDVSKDVLVERLTGRRTCEQCGQPYHVTFLPPKTSGRCDRCGGSLKQRSDDTEAVVRKRLEVFGRENDRLLDYYRSQGRLESIDASGDVDGILRELEKLLA